MCVFVTTLLVEFVSSMSWQELLHPWTFYILFTPTLFVALVCTVVVLRLKNHSWAHTVWFKLVTLLLCLMVCFASHVTLVLHMAISPYPILNGLLYITAVMAVVGACIVMYSFMKISMR
jgi:hypothetical protein